MASKKTEPERLAVLETKVTNIEQGQARVEVKMDTLIDKIDSNFVTKDEFKAYKQSQIWQKLLIAIGFTFIGALITYFFNNIGK